MSDHPPFGSDGADALRTALSSDALLVALTDQEDVAVTIVDRDLRVVHTNHCFGLYGDKAPADVIGLPLADALPAVASQIVPETRRVLETGRPEIGREVCRPHPTDPLRSRFFRAHRSPVFSPRGEVIGVISTVMEITDLRRVQLERDTALGRYRSIFEGAAVGILRTDLSRGRVIEVNPAIERMLGYSIAELTTMEFRDYTHPDDVAENLQLFAELVDGTRDSFQFEKRCIRKDGDLIWIRVTAAVEPEADGARRNTVTMFEDITERKLAEEMRARQAELAEHQATHDSLTGLANRRALFVEVARALDMGPADASYELALFDLDGFKAYNDVFGHPAGDALLERLARRLRDAIAGRATAYRLGGDEFCVFASAGDLDQVIQDAREALCEVGDGFAIRCSSGSVQLPAEALSLDSAMQLADERLYADKRANKASDTIEARDAVVALIGDSSPRTSVDVAELAAATATRLGLSDEDVACTRIAAQLHDIGKSAMPDAILAKPGPLDSEEWAFVRRHSLIGERIVAAAPALARIAPLVRASHERPDGTGYPDGLVMEEIPIGARIVAVVDAFSAMVEHRSYRQAMTTDDALAELRRCAGSQFDGAVVDAFADALDPPSAAQRPAA